MSFLEFWGESFFWMIVGVFLLFGPCFCELSKLHK